MRNGNAKKREDSAVPVEPPGVMQKLEAARQEFNRYQFWLGLARVFLAEIVLGSALVFADWMWVLPVAVRGLGLLAMIGLGGWVALRSRRAIDRAATAAEAEAHFPELGQRLRTVVEYAEPAPDTAPASAGLVKALSGDTERRSSGLEFRKLVPWVSFERRAVALFLTATCGLVALLVGPGLPTAVLRMLLLPLYYTSLKVEPGDQTLKAGDELKLDVNVIGRPVRWASWSIRESGGGRPWITASLAPHRAAGEPRKPLIGALSASLKDCQTDFDYRVVAGEVESPIFHVRVVHPLLIKGIEATITPPPYTRRPAHVVKEGNFRAIEGSRVRIAVTLDRAASTAELVWGSPGDSSRQSIPLKIDGARLTGELPPITKEVQYEIAAADGEGMKLEAAPYRVKFQADDKPVIHFIEPEESLAVTPTTEVPIQVEAGDDFGLTRLEINYKVGDGPEETLHLATFENQPVTAQALVTLYLEKHKLTFTDAITYYASADDNYPPKPHRVVSELRYIDILPYKQVYKFVEGQPGSSGRSLSLEELIARQRVNLNRTFFLEQDRSLGDAAVMRLATFEEELATATAEFSEGLKAIGTAVPALDDAASAMRAATISLDAKAAAAARPQEETALKLLISARRNLQKLLAQNNQGQASEYAKFDRQQVQRIRRPRQDDKLAELEADLQELAKREQDFSEEIAAKGGGGAKVDPAHADKAQAEPVEAQKEAAEEAERLRQLALKDRSLTALANRRLDDAAKMVQESSRSIQAGRAAEAAEQARDAARKLESAARQVGALKARDLTDRLARQRDLAQAIAQAERELGRALDRSAESKDGGRPDSQRLAQKQGELADEVAAMADVLKQLKMAAAEEAPELALSISRATNSNPPEDIEESMRINTREIVAGQVTTAARSADRIAEQLAALAQDLESVRRTAIQPQLDRLLAAEKQAAELQDRIGSVKQSSQQAEAEKAYADFAQLLERIAPGDGPLKQATDQLTQAAMSNNGGWGRSDKVQPGEIGYFIPPVGYTGSLSAAILALQAKIQEIVLESALVERTGPVPPQYKNLVEDYYRVLSQDLR